MMPVFLFTLSSIAVILCAVGGQDDFLYEKFPENFVWSTATSAYQIEGAWNADGKGDNIWDVFSHTLGKVNNNDTGDVACDSYNKYKEDVKLIKALGVSHYRFSLSWSRILPNGTGKTSSAGIEYYNGLLTELKNAGIEPMVTLYHWDLPQALQEVGGFENETIVDAFTNYAKICFDSFGDKVKFWITFNEPYVFLMLGLGYGSHAPGYTTPATSPYIGAHNVLKAHASVYHLYNDTYRAKQNGIISITLDSGWSEPKDRNNPVDVAASERAMQFHLGWFMNPIFINGDYPEVMKTMVAERSRQQGKPTSRLPSFTEDEKTMIKGTADFAGLNHYSTTYTTYANRSSHEPSYENDQDIESSVDPSWPSSGSVWLKVVPWGMRSVLGWIKNTYNNPPLYITENGVSDNTGTLEDTHRMEYYRDYINNVLKAITIDGCDVRGYTAWSLMDNFEWAAGYSEKFGMHYVDFANPERPRIAKKSAEYYAKLVRDNGFIQEDTTTSTTSQKPNAAIRLGASFMWMLCLLYSCVCSY